MLSRPKHILLLLYVSICGCAGTTWMAPTDDLVDPTPEPPRRVVVSTGRVLHETRGTAEGANVPAVRADPSDTTQPSAPNATASTSRNVEKPQNTAAAATSSASPSDAKQLENVLQQLKTHGQLPPTQQAQLRNDLEKANADNSTMLARQLQALLAYQEAKRHQPPPNASPAAPPVALHPQGGNSPSSAADDSGEDANPLRAVSTGEETDWRQTGGLRETVPAPRTTDVGRTGSSPVGTGTGSAVSQTEVQPAEDGDSNVRTPSGGSAMATSAVSSSLKDGNDLAPPVDVANRLARAESPVVRQPVSLGSAVTPEPWQVHLRKTIDTLAASPAEVTAEPFDEVRRQAHLRLLHLIAEDTDSAVEPIESLESREQEFWSHQLHGLALYLDRDGMPVRDRRVALALRELREATSYLAETSTLDLRSLAFCSAVDSYGVYTVFPDNEFEPDQEILLYVEVDSFSSKRTADGYVTSLQGSYQIFDASGRRVADHTFPIEQETCRNRRRDYFIPYRMWMPKKIYPGDYVLQLTVEDTQAQKFGQSSVQFSIKP